MFLTKFNIQEKESFLKLAHHVARCDGFFSDEEQVVIDSYCAEMEISDVEFEDNDFDLKRELSTFANENSQNIVLMEIMTLIFSDDDFDAEEEKILNAIASEFKMDESHIKSIMEWSQSIILLFKQGEAWSEENQAGEV